MISLIGCGWLGKYVATCLLTKDHQVIGSTTRKEGADLLRSLGVKPVCLTVSDTGDVVVNSDDIFLSPILILTLPFRRDFLDPAIYLNQIKGLIRRYCDLNLSKKWVIFTSSTSIYPLIGGIVREDDVLNCMSQRQQVLSDVEGYLLGLAGCDATILRCAGLYGYNRRIAHFLSGKTVLNKEAPVNLIHVDDVVGIIDLVIQHTIKNTTINCVVNHHPTKEALYSFHAKAHGLPLPFFDDTGTSSYKIVSNDRLLKDYDYSFKYTNLFSDYD